MSPLSVYFGLPSKAPLNTTRFLNLKRLKITTVLDLNANTNLQLLLSKSADRYWWALPSGTLEDQFLRERGASHLSMEEEDGNPAWLYCHLLCTISSGHTKKLSTLIHLPPPAQPEGPLPGEPEPRPRIKPRPNKPRPAASPAPGSRNAPRAPVRRRGGLA